MDISWIELLVAQVVAIAYTEFSVRQEKTVNKLFIDYVPPGRRDMSRYHDYGAAMTVGFCAAFVAQGAWPLAILAGLWYWMVFDMRISDNGTFYLGEEADLDVFLHDTLGPNAGLKKAIACMVLIVLFNVAVIFY